MVLGSTQPLTEMNIRNLPGGLKVGRCLRLTTLPPSVSRLSGENVGASAACYRDSCILFLLLLLCLYGPLLSLGPFFSFLILYTVARTPLTNVQPVVRPLPTHRTTQTQNKRTKYRHPCPEWDYNPRSHRSS
jgi:hypothetical protein